MCTQKPPHDYSEELYTRYREAFERYIQEKVRPCQQITSATSACCFHWVTAIHSTPQLSEECSLILCLEMRALEQVLPSLRGQNSEFLLKELHTRWTNHRIMVRWLSKFFNYLDR